MNGNNFQKRYSAAPQRIKDFLISEELSETTKNIVVLTKLDIYQTTQLTEIVANVLLGQISPIDFSEKIESNLKVSQSQARIIIELAKKKIFGQFSKELNQYKSQPLERKIPQETRIERPIDSSESPKIESTKKERIEEQIPKQIPAEPIIPEYSFPEPSKVVVEKPVSKMEELKKVVTPKVSSEQQEKIREKLLAAMQKKNDQPKIVKEMKRIFLKPKGSKQTEEKEKKIPGRIKIGELTSSQILSGEGKKFKDEEVFEKTKKERPYILGAKLKEEKKKRKDQILVKSLFLTKNTKRKILLAKPKKYGLSSASIYKRRNKVNGLDYFHPVMDFTILWRTNYFTFSCFKSMALVNFSDNSRPNRFSLAFGKIHSVPIYTLAIAAIRHFWLPKFYLWKKEKTFSKTSYPVSQKPAKSEVRTQEKKELDKKTLKQLTDILDK